MIFNNVVQGIMIATSLSTFNVLAGDSADENIEHGVATDQKIDFSIQAQF